MRERRGTCIDGARLALCRLVPLNNSNKLISQDEYGKTVTRKETEDLRPTTLAFILGIRGQSKPTRPLIQGYEQAAGIPFHNVGYQPSLMPAMVGTERFQQLCSIEYLNEYFKQVLAGKTIPLDQKLTQTDNDGVSRNSGYDVKNTGSYGMLNASMRDAENAGIEKGQPGRASIPKETTLLNVPDFAKDMGLANSDAREASRNYTC